MKSTVTYAPDVCVRIGIKHIEIHSWVFGKEYVTNLIPSVKPLQVI